MKETPFDTLIFVENSSDVPLWFCIYALLGVKTVLPKGQRRNEVDYEL